MTNGKSKKTAALYITLVFLAGSVFGFAATQFYSANIAQANNGRLSPSSYRTRLLQKLTADLTLNEDQNAKIEIILDEVGVRFHSVRDAMEPEFEAIRSEREARTMAVLDEAQRVKYEQILEERWKKREASSHRH